MIEFLPSHQWIILIESWLFQTKVTLKENFRAIFKYPKIIKKHQLGPFKNISAPRKDVMTHTSFCASDSGTVSM